MSGRFPSRNRVALVGCAQSQTLRRPVEPLGLTAIRTAQQAIADAGLRPEQIDGLVSSALLPSSGEHALLDGVSVVTSDWLAEHMGLRPAYVAGFQGIGQLTGSLGLAVAAVASGAANYVLLHRALHKPSGKYNDNAMTVAGGVQQWTAPQGFFGSLPPIAMVANEYFQRYGATREALGRVVVEARRQGARNPWSAWRDQPLTLDEYLADPPLCDPLGRLDCDMPVDGVGAFVVTTAERARDLAHKPVYVSGFANGYPREHRLPLHWTLGEMQDAGQEVARRLFESAGLGASEIDLPLLYDGFSPYVLIWLEALGYCAEGEAHRFVLEGGIDADRPGGLPVLSGGGALGNGRLHGAPQLRECYLQLSGRAGPRQRRATTALLSYSAPNYGGAVVFSNDPD
jgi:acetyl-CoA acetyltransferase